MQSLDQLNSFERDELIYLARLAEQSERYQEMISFVKAYINKSSSDLSVQQRNILSVAYKNVVSARRTSWRVLSTIESKEQKRGNQQNRFQAQNYRTEVEKELKRLCEDILDLINSVLFPRASGSQSKIFYSKMKGDYYRYIAEFAEGNERNTAVFQAETCYTQAFESAKNELPPTHPNRLGLALNFSVFYYEIKQERTKACDMARQAFDDAIPELDNIAEENYKDSTLILQLLKDNLTFWEAPDAADQGNLNIQ